MLDEYKNKDENKDKSRKTITINDFLIAGLLIIIVSMIYMNWFICFYGMSVTIIAIIMWCFKIIFKKIFGLIEFKNKHIKAKITRYKKFIIPGLIVILLPIFLMETMQAIICSLVMIFGAIAIIIWCFKTFFRELFRFDEFKKVDNRSKTIRLTRFIIASLPIMFVTMFFIAPLYTDFQCAGLARQLKKVPLPAEIQVINVQSEIGGSGGNGDYISLNAIALTKSTLPIEGIESVFESYEYKNTMGDVWVGVEKAEDEMFSNMFCNRVFFKELEGVEDLNDYYYVYLVGGASSIFDVRTWDF